MLLQAQSLRTHFTPSPTLFRPNLKTQFFPRKSCSFPKLFCFKTLKCSLSTVSEAAPLGLSSSTKPFPAEVSRTIVELTSEGTLSTLTADGWPLGIGVRFAVAPDGTPILCLNEADRKFPVDKSIFLLSDWEKFALCGGLLNQLKQCGLRTPQCTIQGSLAKPGDRMFSKRLLSAWTKRFGSEAEEDLLCYIDVEKVLQIEDFKEDGIWVTSSDYKSATPDPLRDFAERIVTEINTNNMEDIYRFCNVYVDLDFQVSEAKMIWVDRLGFDVRIHSPPSSIFDVRIPFPREVTDEKGAKSSFNCMSQIAWEVEKNFHVPDFKKVEQLKQIA